MDAGVTSVKAILEKPLKHLTEEDISQLTREDCRKFLKEKGMRRPSWNKSQAIQQVICLKALLEPAEDSGAGVLRKILVSPPENAPRVMSSPVDSVKELGVGASIPLQEDDNGQYSGSDVQKSTDIGGQVVADMDDNMTISPSYRTPGDTNVSVGQMTIFYCGKVNVYDGVPPAKARAIMHLAASPTDLCQNDLLAENAALWSSPCHLPMASDRCDLVSPSSINSRAMRTEKIAEYAQHCWEKGSITREPDGMGQASRKVSLQRYLEKRKDRGRIFKGKKSPGVASSSLDMYLNHPQRPNTLGRQSSWSNANSPPYAGLPSVFCDSADNLIKSANLSGDLNNGEDI